MKHAAPRRRRQVGRPSRPVLAALALLAAVLVLMGGQGTLAFWTDQATVSTGPITSGTLDITVDGKLAGPENGGGSTTVASLALPNMVPGESVAADFPLENAGSVPLVYGVTGTGSGGLAVVNGLQYSVSFGRSASNTGTAVNGNRSGNCGQAATDANTTLLTSLAHTFAADRPLAVGATDTICIVARLNSNAGNALQGASGSASFVFHARQVGG